MSYFIEYIHVTGDANSPQRVVLPSTPAVRSTRAHACHGLPTSPVPAAIKYRVSFIYEVGKRFKFFLEKNVLCRT